MPGPKPHPTASFDDDVLTYVEEMSDYLAEALLGSVLAPPTAKMTEAEKAKLFANKIWNPDGSINDGGWDDLREKYGNQGLVRILKNLSRRHDRLSADVDALPEPEGA